VSEPTGSQFWWTWTAEAATAIGTIGAVIVALFGGWLRAHLAAPRLEIRLGRGDKKGFRVPVLMSLDGKQIDTVGRWYHLCVENKRRWSPAKDVRLLLLKLEFPDGTIYCSPASVRVSKRLCCNCRLLRARRRKRRSRSALPSSPNRVRREGA
jgi:hypothetical protein